MGETQTLLRAILLSVEQLNASVVALTNRMDKLENAFYEFKAHVEATMATKEDIARLDARMDQIEERIDRIEAQIDRIEEDLGIVKSTMATKEDVAMMTETCATREEMTELEKKFHEADKLHHLKHAAQDQEVMILKQKLYL